MQFSETDYEQHEEAGTVDLTVTLIGQSMNENIVTVQVHAFTRQQFVSQGITCSNPPDFASEVADEGEGTVYPILLATKVKIYLLQKMSL